MRPRKRILYEKLRSWYFTVYIAYMEIIAHELSTTMFVLIKKDYRKKIGRTNRSPRITVYILRQRLGQLALSLFSCCSLFF